MSPLRQATRRIQAFLLREDGPTATEYAVMLAMIILVCIAAIQTHGSWLVGPLNATNGALGG